MEKTYNDFKCSTYQESKSILSLMDTRFWLDIIGSMMSANHCQVGSNLLVYKLKVCRDPEMCVRSIL
jgi:hypothetical protein